MLVPFVIDVDSLAPDPKWTPTQRRNYHKDLLDKCQSIGLLAYDGDCFDNSRLKVAVEQLPQNLRSLWKEMLERVPKIPCGTSWNGAVEPKTLTNFYVIARLAIVEDTIAEVTFEFTEDCDEKAIPVVGNTSGVDICRFVAVNQATQFKNALVQAGVHIEPGDTFQKIWDSRFKTLALAPIKRVSIVDRYAIEQHVFCPQTKLSGLERFLRLLDKNSNGKRYVTLYSAWTPELKEKTFNDVEEDIKLIIKKLPTNNIKHIKLYMVPNSGFRDGAHDRFIRFENFVWDIGGGLEVFEGAFAAKRSQAAFKTGEVTANYEKVEKELKAHPKAQYRELSRPELH